jgi:hypothetical protein
MIFMSYRIYFEPVMLCDDNGITLYYLKYELTQEVANYRTASVQCEQFNDLKTQLKAFEQAEFGHKNPQRAKTIVDNLKT